jgi:hypothetical protein
MSRSGADATIVRLIVNPGPFAVIPGVNDWKVTSAE